MSRAVRGRSFKITKKQAKGYGYARRMNSNPGVTTIAAINGRGSYGANRSARAVMSKLKRNARPAAARRALSASEKAAFKKRMAHARGRKLHANRSTSRAQSASSKLNIRKAQSTRKAWGRKLPRGKRFRVGTAAYGKKPKARRLKAGVYVANRRKKAGSKTMARRRKRASGLTKKRRSSKRRRKSTTKSAAAPKRRRRRKARKGSARRKTAAKKTVRRRRRRVAKKTGTVKRRRRRSRKTAAAPKRRRRRSRRASSVAPKRRRRSRRKGSARRGTRKRRVSRRRRSGGRKLKANRRRRHRRNGRKKLSSSRRKSRKSGGKRRSRARSHKANRRRHRRNGRRLFRKNGVGDILKISATMFAGFAIHRVLSNLIAPKVIAMTAPAAAPAPAATSGFDQTNVYGIGVSIGIAALTGFAVSKIVKNDETKKFLIGGIVMSAGQSLIVSLLQKFMPGAVADALSGPEDGTAARLSAMYGMRGLGAGASIMPRYNPINGLGEYFREPMNGLGEYFREPMNGLGEYISATNGLGTYENNGDLYQAAAGMGSHDYNGNHIDPSGDLDRQLTIAEAAAGVGAVSPFEAAAGIGPMQAAAGFGAIDSVASGDTWIPGTTDGQLWAGVKAITAGQSVNDMTTAGVLQADGGQGIFG